jgi:hypothetical protein
MMAMRRVAMRVRMNLNGGENFHSFLIFKTHRKGFCKPGRAPPVALLPNFRNNSVMTVDANEEKILAEFGRRVQRCYGCFVAFHLKDMYLGEDVSFFCEHCRDDSMFHFSEFSKLLDLNKLREVADAESEENHHHH